MPSLNEIVTKEKLEDLYIRQRLNQRECAIKLDVNRVIIRNRLKKYGIPTPANYGRKRNYIGKTPEARANQLANLKLGQGEKRKKRLPTFEKEVNTVYSRYKSAARQKNKEFSLTKEQFIYLTQQNCFYCGCRPLRIVTSRYLFDKKNHRDKGYIYNGLDRIDSTKGYILDNCIPCCKRCNYAKLSMPQKIFKEWIIQVYEHWARE